MVNANEKLELEEPQIIYMPVCLLFEIVGIRLQLYVGIAKHTLRVLTLIEWCHQNMSNGFIENKV